VGGDHAADQPGGDEQDHEAEPDVERHRAAVAEVQAEDPAAVRERVPVGREEQEGYSAAPGDERQRAADPADQRQRDQRVERLQPGVDGAQPGPPAAHRSRESAPGGRVPRRPWRWTQPQPPAEQDLEPPGVHHGRAPRRQQAEPDQRQPDQRQQQHRHAGHQQDEHHHERGRGDDEGLRQEGGRQPRLGGPPHPDGRHGRAARPTAGAVNPAHTPCRPGRGWLRPPADVHHSHLVLASSSPPSAPETPRQRSPVTPAGRWGRLRAPMETVGRDRPADDGAGPSVRPGGNRTPNRRRRSPRRARRRHVERR
jgi:hypothetical protein